MLRGRYSACFVTWIGGGDGNCLDERYNYGPTSCLGSRCNYVSLNLGAILIEGEEGGGGRRWPEVGRNFFVCLLVERFHREIFSISSCRVTFERECGREKHLFAIVPRGGAAFIAFFLLIERDSIKVKRYFDKWHIFVSKI